MAKKASEKAPAEKTEAKTAKVSKDGTVTFTVRKEIYVREHGRKFMPGEQVTLDKAVAEDYVKSDPTYFEETYQTNQGDVGMTN